LVEKRVTKKAEVTKKRYRWCGGVLPPPPPPSPVVMFTLKVLLWIVIVRYNANSLLLFHYTIFACVYTCLTHLTAS